MINSGLNEKNLDVSGDKFQGLADEPIVQVRLGC